MKFSNTWLISIGNHVIFLKYAIYHILMASTLIVSSQSASISGQVIDKATKEGIPGAHVVFHGADLGTYTNLEGHYLLEINPGIYEIQFSAIGYETATLSDIEITKNESVKLHIALREDQVVLAGVVIEAKADLSNQNILILERKRGAFAKESLSADFLLELGVSQVEDGLTKISGIAKTNNGIYVRGLGDRYNNVYFNGLPLPSANPSRKVVELDIIPADLVRNIDVSKIYRANQFSDVSGASIYIHSKLPTDGEFFKIGFGVGVNSQTTSRSFQVSRDSQVNYLGISGSGRTSPVPINGDDFVSRFNPDQSATFETGFDPVRIAAPLAHNWNVQFGKNYGSQKKKFGILFSSSFHNTYQKDKGLNQVLDAAQAPVNDFVRQRDTRSSNLNSFLGLRYEPLKNWVLDLNYLFINSSENQYVISEGSTIDFEALRRVRNRFLEKRLNTIQFHSKAGLIPNKLQWDTRASLGVAFTDEPDRKDLTFLTQPGAQIGSINRNIAAENGRYFQEIKERENNIQSELTYHLGADTDERLNEITLGYQFRDKGRSTDFRTFTLITGGTASENINLNQLNDLFSNQNFQNGTFSYRDTNGGERQSRVLRTIHAGYLYYRFDLGERIELIPGLRIENTDQQVFFKLLGTPLQAPFQVQEFQATDFLINLNSRYKLTPNRLIRFGLSQTLTRPNFSELIPAPQVNENLQSIVGRPQLLNSKIWNVDLRYDVFPKAGELISFGLFFKHINRPIEQVRSGENFISYFNVTSSNIAGIEFEWQKDISHLLNGVSLSGNASLLTSKVNTNPSQLEDPETRDLLTNVTNSSRTLQGASPYLMNLSMSHEHELFRNFTSYFHIHYHVFGKRVLNVGTQQRGDEFELAVHTLNFIWRHQSQKGLGFTLKAFNLLNPKIQRVQAPGPQVITERVTQSYQQGINFSASVSWTLFDNRLQ